jgi:D-glycero-D-manno-heptose 1,7-bisphosphate phosphatase
MRKALFLDRDGVINKDFGYVYKKSEFEFVDGIFEFVKLFYEKGFHIFIITNQSGIARGFYSEQDFQAIKKYVEVEFWRNGVEISKTYHCSCHPSFTKEPCLCRKPRPDMLLQAQKEFNIDFSNSFFIGDSETDFQAGQSAGVQTYLFSEHNEERSFQKILDSYNSQFKIDPPFSLK